MYVLTNSVVDSLQFSMGDEIQVNYYDKELLVLIKKSTKNCSERDKFGDSSRRMSIIFYRDWK